MLRSMTGYANLTKESENGILKIDMKSLNSRYLDLNLYLSSSIESKETEIRNLLSNKLIRGKIDCTIHYQNVSPDVNPELNLVAARKHFATLNILKNELKLDGEISIGQILQMPDVMKNIHNTVDDKTWEFINAHLIIAINEFDNSRIKEGSKMKDFICSSLKKIESDFDEINLYEPGRIELVKNRLLSKLNELKDKIDTNSGRFEQELLLYAEKLDISEEQNRFSSHLQHFKESLDDNTDAGKRLGFLLQELLREINTLGNKSMHAEIQRKVVLIKEELEKIREMGMNIV